MPIELKRVKRTGALEVKSVVDGKTIYNVYNAAGKLTYVDKATDGETIEYIKLSGKNIARIKNGDEITYLHKDHRGSAVAGTDANGDIKWTEQYTPYGEKRIDDAANDDLGGFTEHIDDSATGLTYMQARYYDPTIGRFLSIDPVGFVRSNPASFNRYVYVNGNPNKYDDPDGEFLNILAGAVAGAVIDIALQAATGTLGNEGSLTSITTSALGGALGGVGLASKVGKLASVGADFAAGAAGKIANNVATGKPLTEGALKAGAVDVIGGAAAKGFADKAGNIAGHHASQINTSTSTAATRSARSAENSAARASNTAGASAAASGTVNKATTTAVDSAVTGVEDGIKNAADNGAFDIDDSGNGDG